MVSVNVQNHIVVQTKAHVMFLLLRKCGRKVLTKSVNHILTCLSSHEEYHSDYGGVFDLEKGNHDFFTQYRFA